MSRPRPDGTPTEKDYASVKEGAAPNASTLARAGDWRTKNEECPVVFPVAPKSFSLYTSPQTDTTMAIHAVVTPRRIISMAPAVLEREITQLDEMQQNAVILFIRFLASLPKHNAAGLYDENRESAVARQKREMEALIGSWDDVRSTEEIIADIVSARTPGRRVEL